MRPAPIRTIGTRHNLLLGADMNIMMMSGLFCGALAVCSLFVFENLVSFAVAVVVWLATFIFARRAAKKDPLFLPIIIRTSRYRRYYPARATPFRKSPSDHRSKRQ